MKILQRLFRRSQPVKPPYRYRFKPKPDLTAYELALVWDIYENAKHKHPIQVLLWIESLPPEMMRHFVKEP